MRSEELRSRLRRELAPRLLIPTLTGGLVTGIVEVVLATSFAALIFSGPLAPYLPDAIGMTLFAAIIVLVTLALASALSGVVGSVQDVSAAVLAVVLGFCVVGARGFEPLTSSASRKRSPPELSARSELSLALYP